MVRAGPVDALVGVGAEQVALTLDERGGQALGAQAVVVGQRRGERRRRYTVGRSLGDDPTPGGDAVPDCLGEVCLLYTSDAADE